MYKIFPTPRTLASFAMAALIGVSSSPSSVAGTVYAFAQQKVYNMLIQSGTTSNLTGNPFTVTTNTSATLAGYGGTSSNTPTMDAAQSFLGNVAAPPENYSATAPYGVPNNTVLTQYTPTAAGLQNAVQSGIPAGGLSASDIYVRSDVLTRIPPQMNGPVDPRWLFEAGFTNGAPDAPNANVSVDSVAEGIGNLPPGTIGSSTSGWTVSGSFVLSASDTVALSFNLIDRLVAFSDLNFQVAEASTLFRLDIKDLTTQESVFVSMPTYSRQLVAPLSNSATRNDNTAGLTNTINGIAFVTPSSIPAGVYTFSITGTTNINVTVVPEPSSYLMTALGIAMLGGLRMRRRLRNELATNA
ncbi:PEP-CTERM sorting domain-containing protein [bacterium]|nr:PEP-CTERM sorting domain-containing protein [bacterium]